MSVGAFRLVLLLLLGSIAALVHSTTSNGDPTCDTEKNDECTMTRSRSTRPIPDAGVFQLVRKAYFQAKSPDDEHDVELKEVLAKAGECGALVPIEIRASKYGRGVFAKQDIPKGTPVWNLDRYGIFRSEQEWRKYLSFLPHNLQHDVIMWSYVLDWDKDDQVVGIDLDQASVMNHGGKDAMHLGVSMDSRDGPSNNLEYADGDDSCYVAKCDIKANEELLCDYSTFHVHNHGLSWYKEINDKILNN